MVKTITSLCEDLNTEWVQKVINAYDWCLKKGYTPKQDSSEIQPLYFKQFLDAKTREDCCYLLSQTPAEVFTTQEEKISNICEQISFNVTIQTTTSDCTRNLISLSREFIRTTYNCLRWAFSDN
ncbi:uncharacterized protein LOC113524014 [Pangasianodon hypophthalmus]|uniref:uncharacterized protein LOC113524014 n=1 Tax=Pangasianodon hypophthalmus TaxID=310915 RepID=UPI0023082C16|nr:uncharacterized protein LOC113524014 [Pangasianodon hypophthalmus]